MSVTVTLENGVETKPMDSSTTEPSDPTTGVPITDSASAIRPATETAYDDVQQLFLHPPPVRQSATFLFASLALFAGASFLQGWNTLRDLVILTGVLAFHELGHALSMRLFGYSDVRVFFIPFFGAAAAGRRRGVARWKQSLVLLMGPLPGIVAGCILRLFAHGGLTHNVATMLLVINGLNLLPIVPLDGGQLFRIILFARHRFLELAFFALASLSLLIGGLWLRWWIFAIIGWAMLFALPRLARLQTTALRLRPRALPSDPGQLTDGQGRLLFDEMRAIMPSIYVGKPRHQARLMEEILERATLQQVSWRDSGWLLALWSVATILAVIGLRWR